MEFDYFYGPEDAEQYQFYRIPKLLITSEQFKDISVEAKLLYGGFLFLMVTQLKKLLSIRKQPDDKVVPTGVNSFFLLRAMLIAD